MVIGLDEFRAAVVEFDGEHRGQPIARLGWFAVRCMGQGVAIVPEQVGQGTPLVRLLAEVEGEIDAPVADMQVVAVVGVFERDVLRKPDVVDHERPRLFGWCRPFLLGFLDWRQPLR